MLVPAFIQVLTGWKAPLIVPVLFNPTQYNLDRSNSYKSTPIPGLGSPLIQFVNGEAATLSMDLFLDDLYRWPRSRPDPHQPGRADQERPAADGGDHLAARHRFARFTRRPPSASSGVPCGSRPCSKRSAARSPCSAPAAFPRRATLSVTFREYRPLADQLSWPRRESADKSKRRQVTAAESIWLIAEREYGDVRAWRAIAAASEVDDPRTLRPGDWLRVPPWEGPDVLRHPV